MVNVEAQAASRAIEARRDALLPEAGHNFFAIAMRLSVLRSLGAMEIYVVGEAGTAILVFVDGGLSPHTGAAFELPVPVSEAITRCPEGGDMDGYIWEGRAI